MPSLIGNYVSANYRKTGWGSKFGTRELVHALITVDNVNLTDFTITADTHYGTVMSPSVQAGTANGLFTQAIQAIQTQGEIYAIGEPTWGENVSSFTVILSADTLADDNFQQAGDVNAANNSNSSNLDSILTDLFGQPVNISYTTMFGLAYN